jgi:hypothetical protein
VVGTERRCEEREKEECADDRVLREERLRRQCALNAAFARVARVSLKVEVVVRCVEKVVIWEEEEGEEDQVARL